MQAPDAWVTWSCPGRPCLFRPPQALNIPDMKRWRKYIVCLLLVTLPVSLWAAVAAPQDCDTMRSTTPAAGPMQPIANAHAHHGMDMPAAEPQDTERSSSIHHNISSVSTEPCCDTCISAC